MDTDGCMGRQLLSLCKAFLSECDRENDAIAEFSNMAIISIYCLQRVL